MTRISNGFLFRTAITVERGARSSVSQLGRVEHPSNFLGGTNKTEIL